MDLKPWKVTFKSGWDKHFPKFDKGTQQRILKKLMAGRTMNHFGATVTWPVTLTGFGSPKWSSTPLAQSFLL